MKWVSSMQVCESTLASSDPTCDANATCCILSLCCRDDGLTDQPITLPKTKPFLMIKVYA